MFCPNCGKQNLENSEFCFSCGFRLKQSDAVQESVQSTQQIQQPIQQFTQQPVVEKKDKKSNKFIFVVLALIVIVAIVFVVKFLFKKDKNNNYSGNSSSDIISVVKADNGIVKFIDGTFTDVIVSSESDAYKALDSLKDELKFNNVKEEFNVVSTESSEKITYYKFQQVYKDVEVYANNLIISVDKSGKVLNMSGYYLPNISVDVNAKKSKEEIEEIAKAYLGENASILESELSILADDSNQRLIYIVSGYSDTSSLEMFIDANDGEVVSSTSLFESVTTYSYTGKGLDNEDHTINLSKIFDATSELDFEYKFYDLEREIAITDFRSFGDISSVLWSAISIPTSITVNIENDKIVTSKEDEEFIQSAISAMANYEKIYDFYKNNLGRDSYDNKGSKIIVNLGVKKWFFSDEDLNNAQWFKLTNQMYIGNYNGKSLATSLDVLAHEFTHGVVNHIVKFAAIPKGKDRDKAFETGSLKEGIPDIMGHLIEGKNWTINEEIEVLRNAINPNSLKYPSVKGGKYYYPDGYIEKYGSLENFLAANNLKSVSDYENGGKHHNSNVVSHAAYLMYDNGAFTSKEEMAKVWYNSLFLMSSYSNFEDCALAVLATAENLGLSDESIAIIEDAFVETNMLEDRGIELSGEVTSGEETLEGVKITVKGISNKELTYEFTTDSEGKYSGTIKRGIYLVTFEKEGFKDLREGINVHGDTTLNVSLAAEEVEEEEEENSNNCKFAKGFKKCKSKNCHTLTLYFMEGSNSGVEESCMSYSLDDGTVLGTTFLGSLVNSASSKIMETDGETFKIVMGDITIDFGWYYKDTDNKFNFNSSITEDIELEMKYLNGFLDNDFIKDMTDFFSGLNEK